MEQGSLVGVYVCIWDIREVGRGLYMVYGDIGEVGMGLYIWVYGV